MSSFRNRRLAYAPVGLAWPNEPTIGSCCLRRAFRCRSAARRGHCAGQYHGAPPPDLSGPAPLVTPAGTFQCYKVESEREASTAPREDMVMRTRTRVVDYYSPAVGIVKTEVYNKMVNWPKHGSHSPQPW